MTAENPTPDERTAVAIDKYKDAVESQDIACEVVTRSLAVEPLKNLLSGDELRNLLESRDRFAEDAQLAARRAIEYSNELYAVKAELGQCKARIADLEKELNELLKHTDSNCVEVWHGSRKVTITNSSVLMVWGPNINDDMLEIPRTLESVQQAMEWLYFSDPNLRPYRHLFKLWKCAQAGCNKTADVWQGLCNEHKSERVSSSLNRIVITPNTI